jgi:uncharacterized membrane protein YsdA (DUF1294 family)/cold shock CspA family protein
MRFYGSIKIWHDDRGFGFIEPKLGGQDIFVHIKAFSNISNRPLLGQAVSFEVSLGSSGKKQAINVEQIRTAHQNVKSRDQLNGKKNKTSLIAIPLFIALYAVATALWKPSPMLALSYACMSIVTFITYAMDKSAAVRGGWRTSEGTLHLLGLAGGWPGALLAQHFLRHKSSKTEFRTVFWATAILNTIGFIAFCSQTA